VGVLSPDFIINPLFTEGEGVESDITNLVFAGLMRYDAESGEIRDYLADHTLSPNKRIYEFTLRSNVTWHDGQPITANDILYTYRDVVQSPDFSNALLRETFRDILIERVDERTVRFTIPEKRKTFFTNFTLGLLPRHQLSGVPISELRDHSFNQNPVGAGPYRFRGITLEPQFTEVTLSAFDNFFLGRPHIDTISLRIFPNREQLLANIEGLDAIRPLQTRESKNLPHNPKFSEKVIISPKYLAVFFNLKDETLTTKNIRQAMRAAVDTTQIAEGFSGIRIDTPLVELWPQNDIVNISEERAGELMNEAGYFFPSEKEIVEIPTSSPIPKSEKKQENPQNKYIQEPSTLQKSTTGKNAFYVTGITPEGTRFVRVNGYTLKLFSPSKGTFSYQASTKLGTLKKGENIYTVVFRGANNKTLTEEKSIVFYEPDDQKRAAREKAEQETLIKEGASPEEKEEEISPIIQEEKTELYRLDEAGEHITLSLSYLDGFPYLFDLSEQLQSSWKKIGVEIHLIPLNPEAFRDTLRKKEYELLLLPQHLGYNLDAYPYFHLSQVGENGLNVAEWKNLEASVLLEEIRATHDHDDRRKNLQTLRDIIIDEVPAIFLFTPKTSWMIDGKVKNVELKHMAVLPDRFSNANDFFVAEKRQMFPDITPFDFFPWLLQETKTLFSFSS